MIGAPFPWVQPAIYQMSIWIECPTWCIHVLIRLLFPVILLTKLIWRVSIVPTSRLRFLMEGAVNSAELHEFKPFNAFSFKRLERNGACCLPNRWSWVSEGCDSVQLQTNQLVAIQGFWKSRSLSHLAEKFTFRMSYTSYVLGQNGRTAKNSKQGPKLALSPPHRARQNPLAVGWRSQSALRGSGSSLDE